MKKLRASRGGAVNSFRFQNRLPLMGISLLKIFRIHFHMFLWGLDGGTEYPAWGMLPDFIRIFPTI